MTSAAKTAVAQGQLTGIGSMDRRWCFARCQCISRIQPVTTGVILDARTILNINPVRDRLCG
ncbi:MAG: hypothetical protein HC795_02555 [Coleofasciculaceae cyanobacterium RL_1_1]|nr:hypothetical protein [Coleofasciculaceae cyanobacterium RL_1_1]